MNRKRLSCLVLGSALVVVTTIACTQETADDPAFANDEAALKDPSTGAPACGGKKVLICHIPPGNPANMHEICVGEPAVAPHIKNHGDYVGACAPSDAGTPPPVDDAGTPPPPVELDSGSTAPDSQIR